MYSDQLFAESPHTPPMDDIDEVFCACTGFELVSLCWLWVGQIACVRGHARWVLQKHHKDLRPVVQIEYKCDDFQETDIKLSADIASQRASDRV